MEEKKFSTEKLKYVLKVIVAVLIAVTVGVLAVVAGVNLGGLLNKLLGKKKEQQSIVDKEGDVIGTLVDFVGRKNPFRDKSIVKLSNGEKIDLPKGIQDTDVASVIKIETGGGYAVTPKHTNLTDISAD